MIGWVVGVFGASVDDSVVRRVVPCVVGVVLCIWVVNCGKVVVLGCGGGTGVDTY